MKDIVPDFCSDNVIVMMNAAKAGLAKPKKYR